ncbi:retention in endoplasmic reticulum protein 1 [Globomyces sp. JEL0801]|nr:retention in endoplasmic reticulum protein 1 [Globomyces sp. JEL0801]
MSLSVPGRDSENPTSMQSLIASYFKSEVLEYKCQSCDGNRARASLSLASLPKSLILHIKRFDMGARYDQLSRDEKGFLIDRTLIKRKYELIGIVNHRGHDIDFGHYTFNYHLPGDQSEWIIFDDAKVKKGMYCLESESKKDAYIRYQKTLDDLTPYTKQRWAVTAVFGLVYVIRAVTAEGWYIVTYALGIYLLNVLLAFLTPKFDPALEAELNDEDDGPMLPTKADDEFRPFIRRLPEFKFWYDSIKSDIHLGIIQPGLF